MSYTPATLAALNTLWKSKGGSLLGVVGSMRTHRRGYHLGRDRIFATGIAPSCAEIPTTGTCVAGEGWNDYSVRLARDKAGLTNAAMAIDLGPLSGHAGSEVALAKWLIKQCQAGAADTKDIRAINYTIWRWDRQRGQTSGVYEHGVNETGHIHIEWYRDSQARDKTAAIRRWLTAYLGVKKTVACSGGKLWSGPSKDSTALIDLPAGTVCTVFATVAGGAWSFSCNGTPKAGTSWFKVTALSKSGYVAAGRF